MVILFGQPYDQSWHVSTYIFYAFPISHTSHIFHGGGNANILVQVLVCLYVYSMCGWLSTFWHRVRVRRMGFACSVEMWMAYKKRWDWQNLMIVGLASYTAWNQTSPVNHRYSLTNQIKVYWSCTQICRCHHRCSKMLVLLAPTVQ